MIPFDKYLAESGRQSELDRLRATGQYEAAKAQYENGLGQYSESLKLLDDNTKRYYDDLVKLADEDLNFVLEKLDKEHQLALGNNDTQRAQFIESVADKLEAKYGRIPYDYKIAKKRIERNNRLALKRLNEDARVLRQRINTDAQNAREQQMASLNARGLVDGSRENISGLGGKNVADLEREIADRMAALDRQLQRSRQDMRIKNIDSLADLKTGARRDALDTQRGYEISKLTAQKNNERLRKQYERAKKIELNNNLAGSFNLLP